MTGIDARAGYGGLTEDGGARSWSIVTDGPPLIVVAPVFVVLLAVWLPERLIGPEIVGVLAIVVIGALWQVQTWPWIASVDQANASASIDSLGRRLRAARAEQMERDRYR